MGAGLIIGVDGDDNRLAMSKHVGADVTLDYRDVDIVAEVKRLTGGGADVGIEALGTQQALLKVQSRPGDVVQSGRLFRQACYSL